MEQISFELVPAVLGLAPIKLPALFVADHSENEAGLSRQQEDQLISQFVPILHFNAGERFAVPFDVSVTQAADFRPAGTRTSR